jgi:hypothetical protein
MTQQYVAGELSIFLGELQAATADQSFARFFADLRREAETKPPAALGGVTVRALALTDDVCWQLLTQADTVGFTRQAGILAELHDFGVCAGLLPGEV